jgi:hypothetical protein
MGADRSIGCAAARSVLSRDENGVCPAALFEEFFSLCPRTKTANEANSLR